MTNKNNGGYQSQDRDNDQMKDNQQAGQRNGQNKKNAKPSDAGGQWTDKKNASGSDSDSEQE